MYCCGRRHPKTGRVEGVTRLSVGLALFLVTFVLIIARPRGLSEGWAALGGALTLLLGGYVGPFEAAGVRVSEWNAYGFFLGLMTIAALADQAGVFDLLATLAARWAGGSAFRLYLGVFALGVITTMFLSNDATALILTPVVYALVTRLRLPVMPFMFACTFIADTASFLLPVSNPTNILVLDAFGNGLLPFLRYLFLPALACVGINVALFLVAFRRSLRIRYAIADPQRRPAGHALSPLCAVQSGGLRGGLCASPPRFRRHCSLVALGGGALLLFGALRIATASIWQRLGERSWSLFGFIAGLFLVVQAVDSLGSSRRWARDWCARAGSGPLEACWASRRRGAVGRISSTMCR